MLLAVFQWVSCWVKQSVVGVICIGCGIVFRTRDRHLAAVARGIVGIAHRQAAGFAFLRQPVQAVIDVACDLAGVIRLTLLAAAGVIGIGKAS